ncbi:Cytochrome P450 4C1 [Temnothorax longispinosus]|uniref:Cytochrome P450 4C1 n=1 Tax=Temnothorax longispinosus TaxID=300112 RepID=A0A4S2KU45_9HYME|nr:Cytochrome P450 4C1 [Temnothorax longispinosus]
MPFCHLEKANEKTAMDTSLPDLDEFQQQYRKAVYRICKLLIYMLVRQWLHNDWIFSLTSKGIEQAKIL